MAVFAKKRSYCAIFRFFGFFRSGIQTIFHLFREVENPFSGIPETLCCTDSAVSCLENFRVLKNVFQKLLKKRGSIGNPEVRAILPWKNGSFEEDFGKKTEKTQIFVEKNDFFPRIHMGFQQPVEN